MTHQRESGSAVDLLPLKPVDFLVLLTLAERELHGYGIVASIAERTEGKLRLVPGNLYAVLQRLRGEELLDETDRRPAADLDDQRRRYYAITPWGRLVLTAEAERLRSLVGVAEAMNLI
jgi:DNA-binding PadR family transcriptional regulator